MILKVVPQLDSSFFTSQLVWLVLSFFILYIVMTKIAIPKVGSTLEKRRRRIASDLDQASTFREEADQVISDYEASLAQARVKAQDIAKDVRADINAQIKEEQETLEARLALKAKEAEAKIMATKSDAMGAVSDMAADVAQDMVKSLLGKTVAKSKIKTTVSDISGS